MSQLPFTFDPENLFGREHELKQFAEAIAVPRERTLMLLMTGIGGSGKTYLLSRIEQLVRDAGLRYCPLYDFYHIENFKASSIERAIIAALDPSGSAFAPYFAKRAELDQLREGGADFAATQKQLRATFVACYNLIAAGEHEQGRAVVLLFDTAEQAVDLTDQAAEVMIPGYKEASWGGEFWLEETLPQLANTVVVVSGREEGLDGEPVAFYARLKGVPDFAWAPLVVSAIPEAEAERFLSYLLERERAHEDPYHSAGGFASSITLNPLIVRIWYEVSGGLPFWLSLLLTAQMFGVMPDQVDVLRDEARDGAGDTPKTDWRLTDERRKGLRDLVVKTLLQNTLNRRSEPRLILLQWMVSLRKGLSQELLAYLLEHEPLPGLVPEDAEQLFTWLNRLVIVKSRDLPDAPRRKLLFLHDEVYLWLTRDADLSAMISELALGWHTAQIQATLRRQRELSVQLYSPNESFTSPFEALRAPHGDAEPQPEPELYLALRRELSELAGTRNQLELDRLGYIFQLDFGRGMASYNVLAYTALERRDYGYNITVRQEGLRNIYRAHKRVPEAIVEECAARWVLRALHGEPSAMADLLPRLRTFCASPGDARGLPGAFLLLAEAQAKLFYPERNLAEIGEALDRAAEIVEETPSRGVNAIWRDFLLAQIYNWRGFLARLRYELDRATQEYRKSLRQAGSYPELPNLFRGVTLNNLAYTYAEQGDIATAREYSETARDLLLAAGSEYSLALCHNAIARIENRAGNPLKALEFSNKAVRALRDRLNSVRGQGLCLPVRAEAWRKLGEELTHDRVSQHEAFQRALSLFAATERRFDELKINGDERRRELYQQWGCTHRSLARELSHYDPDNPEIARNFDAAEYRLRQALAHVERGGLPALFKVDLYEDIAVIRVHRDQYDADLEALLSQAEAAAPDEYKIHVASGAPELPNATRAYWRELGQCQLQRIMQSLGHYDGSQRADKAHLAEAAKHMVLMFAYLYRYAPTSWMHGIAERLTLRELRNGYTVDEIRHLAHSVFDAARDYSLLDSQALRHVSRLIQRVENDYDLLPNPRATRA